MSRTLDTFTLNNAARDYAAMFSADRAPFDRKFVEKQLYLFDFKDEFDHIVEVMGKSMGPEPLKPFSKIVEDLLANKPRSDKVFHKLLEKKLAVDPEGNHVPGKIGTTNVGSRVVGKRIKIVQTRKGSRSFIKNVYWPMYAGEAEERVAYSKKVGDYPVDGQPYEGVADELPPGAEPLPVGALNTRISNEIALLMCDACVDNLDEGAGAAVVEGRVGGQPTDPDTAVTGVLLFTLVCAATAFGAAVDAAPGGIATAAAISDDTNADATGTLGYCRASSTTDGLNPIDDHIDGEAGTSGADFNFNTLSIVSGATVSLTDWTVTMPES